MKAHDVRYLRVCKACSHVGDSRKGMLVLADGHYHDSCAIGRLSLGGLMRLPQSERDKITIGAAGPALMRKLMDGRNLRLVQG